MDIERSELEIRSLVTPIEAVDVDEERQAAELPPSTIGVLRGMATLYESEIELMPGVREEIARGAAKKTLRQDRQVALVGHDMRGLALGRTDSGTFRLRETDEGIESTLYVPDTEQGRALLTAVERKDVRGMSIGFAIVREEREILEKAKGTKYRLTEIRLYEASYVNFPAYQGTETPGLQIGRSRRAEFEARGRGDELPADETRSSSEVYEEPVVVDDGDGGRAERERSIALAAARLEIAALPGERR